MSSVDLTDQEWQQVMAILSTASWRDANPLLMKIGQQLSGPPNRPIPTGQPIRTDGKEQTHE